MTANATTDDFVRRQISVAIVDDDVWMRTGRATALRAFDDLDVTVAVHPTEAINEAAHVASVDVVVVDAHDPDAGFDRFNGVEVVRRIRSARPGKLPVIVVVTGHARNDLLRRRMAEAGADVLYSHRDVQSPEALCRAVRVAAATSDAVRPAMARALVGEQAATVNAAVDWAALHLGDEALVDESQKALPVSRRTIMTARARVATALGVPEGEAPPTWRTVAQFLNRARGKDVRQS
jgi:DNA-binding NarL/FixJ family response regulator